MGFNYAPPPTTLAPKGLIAGASISALGDSISAQGSYFPVGASMANVPAWAPSITYVLGNLVLNNGLLYRCSIAGTSAASGGPTGQTTATDGSASWAYLPYLQNRSHTAFLHWVEVFSAGALKWNMAQGYAGISNGMVKALILSPGAGYSQGDVVVWANGARGYLNVTGGVPQSVTITNAGWGSVTGFGSPTITTAAGTGCVISNVSQVAGTFGVPGCTTTDMVARLPDCAASTVDVFVVHGGTNDLGAGASFATITGNLKICYETLIGAGKRVIAVPILPRGTGTETGAQLALLSRVNRWIRAYCRREAWANPSQVIVGLADPTRYFTDGTSTTGKPIGAAAAGNGAMTLDGLHPSPRGAQHLAIAIIAAAQALGFGTAPSVYARVAAQNDGYHPTINPGGNYLEGQPWTASTAVVLGETRSNSPYVYICTAAGTTAASGGPTGTGTGIADGSATWKYLRKAGARCSPRGRRRLRLRPAATPIPAF